ncbi:hypothetical protein COLO4_26392 [Corchorus olitorius]|uniref:Uncharacterized protein n=1 Tax=Corchorus olitorius TaxID=93759 RepID=A0A1R3HX81_9ROSI|nr:hypothetical protein COLO4_26392 [Corchorus olitorius]
MATTRLLNKRPLGRLYAPSSSCPSSPVKTLRCISKGGLDGEKKVSGNGAERKPTVAVKASVAAAESVVISKPEVNWGKELAFLLAKAINSMREVLIRPVFKPIPWKSHVQMLIQKVIIDCRFFTMFAVGGSLLDMFLVGTGMLIFGMGLYIMFVGSKTMKGGVPSLPRSNLFGLFHLKALPAWVEMESVSEAKSKIGHAVMMLLQAGVLEKFKSIPLVSSLDLACFAGAVFISALSIFVLSRLSFGSSSLPGHR